MGLIAAAGIALLAWWFLMPEMKRYKGEKRDGTLLLFRGNCILIPAETAQEDVVKRSDKMCVSPQDEQCANPIGTDGLELNFCKNHQNLLGKNITVYGRRVSSADIVQDCLNRSCFADVSLVE